MENIILDSTAKSLSIGLDAATSASHTIDVTVSYVDVSSTGALTDGAQETPVTAGGLTQILAPFAAPAVARNALTVTVVNNDTAQHTIKIYKVTSGGNFLITEQVLAIGASWDSNLANNLFDMAGAINGATTNPFPLAGSKIGFWDASFSALRSMTLANLQAWLQTYLTPINGWSLGLGTWTYSSADAPTFVISTSLDNSATIGVGDRIQLTQTTVKYFIVTAITSSTITVYGGTDYILANASITSPSFSHAKNPLGFPIDPAKWTVTLKSTTSASQATPTNSVWYNVGANSINIPIGAWRVWYSAWAFAENAMANRATVMGTLSTANNSESDNEFRTGQSFQYAASGSTDVYVYGMLAAEKQLNIASKTTYYLNLLTLVAATSIGLDSTAPILIKAVCAYL